MNNLKGVNLAQIAKDGLNEIFEEVKKRSMEAVLSNDCSLKDAVIIANMALIDQMVRQEIRWIDQNQKTTMDISGVIANIARKIEEDDSDGMNSEKETK